IETGTFLGRLFASACAHASTICAAQGPPLTVGKSPKDRLWRKNKAQRFRYRRERAATRRTPVFLCMPLINRSYIFDLRPWVSFVEFLLREGHEVFLLDWGTPGDEDRGLDIEAYVMRYLGRTLNPPFSGSDCACYAAGVGGVHD